MVLICPECRQTLKDNEMFCPECGAIGELLDESKLGRKTTLNKEVYDYLYNEFDEVLAVGYQNVKGIDLYDERLPPKEKILTRWIKESSSLVLKDNNPFLSVEMMATTNTTPIVAAGNVLVHSIADSAVVKYQGRKQNVEYPLDGPRFLLIIIPDPDEDVDSSKNEQMKIIEGLIKELKFLGNSPLEDFKICLMNEFEKSIKQLIK